MFTVQPKATYITSLFRDKIKTKAGQLFNYLNRKEVQIPIGCSLEYLNGVRESNFSFKSSTQFIAVFGVFIFSFINNFGTIFPEG